MTDSFKVKMKVHLTLEQHRSELNGYTYTQIFSINILEIFLEIHDNLKKRTVEMHSLEISKKIKKNVGMS